MPQLLRVRLCSSELLYTKGITGREISGVCHISDWHWHATTTDNFRAEHERPR
jgi:hypothetical protein